MVWLATVTVYSSSFLSTAANTTSPSPDIAMTSLPPRCQVPGGVPATANDDDYGADGDPLLGGRQRAHPEAGVGGWRRRPYSIGMNVTNRKKKEKGRYDGAAAVADRMAVSKRNFGMLLLGVVVLAWVSSSFLTHVRSTPPLPSPPLSILQLYDPLTFSFALGNLCGRHLLQAVLRHLSQHVDILSVPAACRWAQVSESVGDAAARREGCQQRQRRCRPATGQWGGRTGGISDG